jgi:hypothetical protein
VLVAAVRLWPGQTCRRLTVGEWLAMWLAGKKGRPSAISRDEGNIRLHLKPRIGHIRLDRLRVSHLSKMFAANVDITEGNTTRRSAIEDVVEIPWKVAATVTAAGS